jgi:hypothetical protein
VGCVTASTVEASLAEKNPRVRDLLLLQLLLLLQVLLLLRLLLRRRGRPAQQTNRQQHRI